MREWRTRDFTFNRMLAALEEVVAAFPVYRTYVSSRGASADDRRYIDWALGLARKRWRSADVSIFDFLRGVLTGEAAPPQDDASPGGPLYAAMHFQQVTGPVMAKAAEDTAFYRYVRLLALNEVGGDPRRFGMSVAAFHHLAQQRARQWPQAMVTTATHDTKRGEDARARLALLSEMPREWGRRVSSLAAAQPLAPGRGRRRDRARPQCRISVLSSPARRLAAGTRAGRSRRDRKPRRADRGLHDQGGPRTKARNQLEQSERRLRSSGDALCPRRARRVAAEPVSRRFSQLRRRGRARRGRSPRSPSWC